MHDRQVASIVLLLIEQIPHFYLLILLVFMMLKTGSPQRPHSSHPAIPAELCAGGQDSGRGKSD